MDALDLSEQLHELKRQRWLLEDKYQIVGYRSETPTPATRGVIVDPIEYLRKDSRARLIGLGKSDKPVCRLYRQGDSLVYEPIA